MLFLAVTVNDDGKWEFVNLPAKENLGLFIRFGFSLGACKIGHLDAFVGH